MTRTRRIQAIALAALALLGATATAASADPQNIQKPGHIA